jgi:hypothetical protein
MSRASVSMAPNEGGGCALFSSMPLIAPSSRWRARTESSATTDALMARSQPRCMLQLLRDRLGDQRASASTT